MLDKNIKYFLSVVKNNSFSLAAEECYISQSAISQGIKALESELGLILLDRKNRSFILTPAGRFFYEKCLEMAQLEAGITAETMRIAAEGLQNQVFTIAYSNTYYGQELGAAIHEFSNRYPSVQIRVIRGTHEKVYNMLNSNEADLGINDLRRQISVNYNNVYLTRKEIFIEASPSIIQGRETVSPAQLVSYPCIVVAGEKEQEDERQYYKKNYGIEYIMFTESQSEASLLVSGNVGYLPVEWSYYDQANTQKARLVIDGKPVHKDYYLFWKKEYNSLFKQTFSSILQNLHKE